MMALNIAVPLATVGDLMDGFGLLSPISPLTVDCRSVAAAGSHGKKQLVSPVGSESSGVSSLDSDEIKKPTSPPSTPTEEVERPRSNSPLSLTSTVQSEGVIGQDSSAKSSTSSSCSSTRSSLSSADSIIGSGTEDSSSGGAIDETLATAAAAAVPAKEIKVVLGGRDVLNLIDNLTTPSHFRLQFAQLPENDNIHFFLDNRSQYHRLGANGHIQEYTMVKCKCCDFRYPVNGTSMTSSGQVEGAGRNAIITAFQQIQQHQQQQQQQQQQLQWNSFTNNFNSIANNRDKLSLSVAPNAFNKTFGGGNSSNNNSGSQYFRGGNMVANLFGRDSNRNNFLNSTSTYNNHKSYQQNFGAAANNNNNSKFNAAPYGGSYQLQQQQTQQPFYSKNHPMRYGNTSGNNSNAQSNGSGAFNTTSATVAAAAALASQNLLNFNNFTGSNSSFNSKNNNNNNMFAYYKTMM